MDSVEENSFEELYRLDGIKATYYVSHVVMTVVSPCLLYR